MKRSETGFTLIEVMIVMVIIGLIAAAVLGPRLLERKTEAQVTAARAQIANLKSQVDMFSLDNDVYPEKLGDLVNQPSYAKNWHQYWDGDIPQDPWGHDYIYRKPGRNGLPYEIISYGADGQEGGEGNNADISSADLSGKHTRR